jgi:dihydropteroate synthase
MARIAPQTVELPVLLRGLGGGRFWLRPLLSPEGSDEHGPTLALAGTGRRFAAVEILARRDGRIFSATATLAQLTCAAGPDPSLKGKFDTALTTLSNPRPPWAGLPLDRTLIMGILNVTPDSFFDGGVFFDPARAIAHGRALLAAGADIVDIGGESTRPGAVPVSPDEELRRVEPVVRALAAAGAAVSIDTRHASVMAGALAAGARIINDISALSDDPSSLALAIRTKAPVVLMHKQGNPATMQRAPAYSFAPLDVLEYLDARVTACTAAGIARAGIVVDPGIGFGKTGEDNRAILDRLTLLHSLGVGVLVGLSRKFFLGGAVEDRLAGSLAGALDAAAQSVQILRVHDVAETRRALARVTMQA